jgi:hypothetical protein
VNTASEVTIEKSSLDPDATVVADVKALTGSRETLAPVAEIVAPPTAPPPPPSPATPRRIQAGRHAGKIVVAASLAAITAGALWFLQSRPQRPEETTAAIRATPTATGRSSPKAALDERTEGPAASADAPAAAVAVAIVPPAAPPTSGSQPRSAGPDAPIDPRSEVRTSLSRYVRAIETKDLVLLRRVRPGLTDDETRRWARSFEITRSRKVDLQLHEISVDSDQARAVGRRADVVVMHDGRRVQTQTRFVCTLRRGHEGWVIEDFQETGPRS